MGKITIVSDNQAVLDNAKTGLHAASQYSKYFGGLWKQIGLHGWHLKVQETRKVKSHQSADAVRDLMLKGERTETQLRDVLGNKSADEMAGIARGIHDYSEKDVEDIQEHRADSKAVLKAMARMLEHWQDAHELWGPINELPKIPNRASCSKAAKAELVVEIPGNAPTKLTSAKWGYGHKLVVVSAQGQSDMVVCRRCGCRAGVRLVGLKKQCAGKPSSNHTKDVVCKLKNGRHPTNNAALTGLATLQVGGELL